MFMSLIKIYATVGLVTFGLRGILADLGIPGWGLMLGLILGASVGLLVYYLAHVMTYLSKLGKALIERRFPAPVRLDAAMQRSPAPLMGDLRRFSACSENPGETDFVMGSDLVRQPAAPNSGRDLAPSTAPIGSPEQGVRGA